MVNSKSRTLYDNGVKQIMFGLVRFNEEKKMVEDIFGCSSSLSNVSCLETGNFFKDEKNTFIIEYN